ncbi:arylsulfatase B-like [Glandiceps talaboti]
MANTGEAIESAHVNPAFEGDTPEQEKTNGTSGKNVTPQTQAEFDRMVAKTTKRLNCQRACLIVMILFGIYTIAVVLGVVLMLGCDNKLFPGTRIGESTGNGESCKERPQKSKPPHIVFFLADDLGWYDVGFNNPDMITPNMDRLAAEGVIFNQSYTHPTCSPSRAALNSGYYSHRTGMQHRVLQQLAPYGLPTNFTILSEALKALGYTTHMIGKWHLGMCKEEFLPLNRGFDSFYGYWNNYIEYYTHTNQDIRGVLQEYLGLAFDVFRGYDFWDNTGSVLDKSTYISYLLNNRAEELIEKHNPDEPMFMYYSSALPHFFLDVPKEYEDMYPDVKNRDRRVYNGMVSMMDEIIGNVTNKLQEKGMWDNTLFIFMSDNGGAPDWSGFNYPLRGAKSTLFEGGARVVTFAHGSMLEKTGYTNDGLMHMTDWYPTLTSLAGGEPDPDMDGMDIWNMISKDEPSPRNEIIYNIDEIMPERGAAIRVGDWKLIQGNHQMFYPIIYDHELWYLPPTEENQTVVSPPFIPTGQPGEVLPPRPEVLYLFNLKDDPSEYVNLAANETEKVDELLQRLEYHRSRLVPALHPPPYFPADPLNTDGIWRSGWC